MENETLKMKKSSNPALGLSQMLRNCKIHFKFPLLSKLMIIVVKTGFNVQIFVHILSKYLSVRALCVDNIKCTEYAPPPSITAVLNHLIIRGISK
ncbi:hypothetical protein, partial [Salmonella sp. s54395]|uniref:hypothetical protein n=1 Tax=Salmonella sp. s54395 TaxID=3159664 RepID=UPI00397F859B